MKLQRRRDDIRSLNSSLGVDRGRRWHTPVLLALAIGAIAVLGGALLKLSGNVSAAKLPGVEKAFAHGRKADVACTQRPDQLQRDVAAIAKAFDGKVGIAITQAGCDWVVGERTDEFFPQQSVSKLWVALSVLDEVDRGRMQLTEPLTLRPEDLVVFNQPLRWRVLQEGSLTLPAGVMMRDALSLSDNLANDKLLWRVGGPDRVRAVLEERKIEGVRFGPGERLLQSHIAGVNWTPDLAVGDNFNRARDRVPMDQRITLLADYVADPLDGATPAGIARTLGRLSLGELLSPASTAVLLDIMGHSKSGPRRLKGGLPPEWKAYHKTGTGQELHRLATGYNDVAVIEAPDGTKYGVAVMIGETGLPLKARMEMMQSVSRALVAEHNRARGYPFTPFELTSATSEAAD